MKNLINLKRLVVSALLALFCGCCMFAEDLTQQVTVKLEKAGTLSGIIGSSEARQITNLKLIGDINGSDVLFMRSNMFSDEGNLKRLDMSECHIVKGGDPYLQKSEIDDYFNYKTSDGVIDSYFFWKAKKLTFLILPDSLDEVHSWAFIGCGTLHLRLPKTISYDYIGWNDYNYGHLTYEAETSDAFKLWNNKCVEGIVFCDGYEETSVTHWNEWTSVEKIVSLGTTPPLIGDSFSDFQKKNLRIIVPTSALEAYKNAPVWKEFFFLKGGAEGVETGIENVKVDADTKHPLYDLNGMAVKNVKRGSVYIKDGKKFVAK